MTLHMPSVPDDPSQEASFDNWYRMAARRASVLNIPPREMVLLHLYLRVTMGEDWLRRQAVLSAKPTTRISDVHPLYRAMISPADQSLVEVVEAARTISAFRDDPKFADAVARLREKDGYAPRFFELAMAFRWKLGTATVTLEPAIPKGLADFDAVISGQRFIVECSSFPGDIVSTDSNALAYTIGRTLSKYLSVDFRATIEVRIDTITPGDFEGDVRKAVRVAAGTFMRSKTETEIREAFGTVRIRRTDTEMPDKAKWGTIAFTTYPTAVLDSDDPGTQVLCVDLPRKKEDRYQKVVDKFREECSQLGNVPEPRVIILDVDGLTYDVHTTNLDKLAATLGDALLAQPKVTSVWLMSRGWNGRKRRFEYHAIRMDNPHSEILLPHAFQERLNDLEEHFDFLTRGTFT